MALSLAVDRLTKWLAVQTLANSPPKSYLGDLLVLEYSQNTGGFLGLGGQMPSVFRFWILVVGVGAVLVGATLFGLFSRELDELGVTGVALFIGGGLGNWADRAAYGTVVDFLNVGIDGIRSGIFNIADLTLELGIGLVLLATWRRSHALSAEESLSET